MINAEDIEELKNLVSQSGNDEQAYTRLYHIYFTPLLKFAVSLVHLPAIAEEIVSDVLLQLWRIRKEAGSINNLTVYLFTCIRNHSLNYLGSKNAVPKVYADYITLEMASPHPDPEQVFISDETHRILAKAINLLPPRCQIIFRLIREDGLKYREVATLLNISQKTVEAQIGLAMKKLADALRESRQIRHLPALRVVS